MNESDDRTGASFDSFKESQQAERLREAWRHAPPEPVLRDFLDSTILADELLLAQVLVADAESRMQRGEAAGLDYYLSLVPELKASSEACVQLLLLELMQNVEDPSAALAAIRAKYGTAFHNDIEEAAGFAGTFSPTLIVGAQLGKYQLKEKLGEGSFGQVWRAWDQELERYVALKLFPPGEDTFRQMRKLREEVRAASGINHPNVVSVRSAGRFLQSSIAGARGWLFIDMELCGDTAPKPDDRKWIEVGKALPQIALTEKGLPRFAPRHSAQMIADLCRGVHQAHIQRVVHCDIKPGNVLVTPSGRAMIADFGLSSPDQSDISMPARHRTGSYDIHHTTVIVIADGKRIRGAPPYMSPEQARGETLNTLSDVYALGAVLYYLLSGRHPYDSKLPPPVAPESAAQDIIAQVADPNALPETLTPPLPLRLRQICCQAMQHDPMKRYTSAAEMGEELEAWLARRSTSRTLPKQSMFALAVLWTRRNKIVAILLAILVLVLLTGITGTTRQAIRATNSERAARLQLLAATDSEADALLAGDFYAPAYSTVRRAHALAEELHVSNVRGDLILSSLVLRSPPPLYLNRAIKGQIQHVRIFPDKKTFATVADTDVVIVDLLTGSILKRLVGHTRPIDDVAISPDGRTLVSTDWSGKVFIWSVADGRILRTLDLSDGTTERRVFSVAYSPLGHLIAIACGNGLRATFDPSDPQTLRKLDVDGFVQSVDFTPDGSSILFPDDNGKWHRISATSFKEEVVAPTVVQRARSIASDPSGSLVFVGTDAGIMRCNSELGKQTGFLPTLSMCQAIAVSPDSALVAVLSQDVRVFDASSGELLRIFQEPSGSPFGGAFTPDSDVLISAGITTGLRVWGLRPRTFPSPIGTRQLAEGTSALAAHRRVAGLAVSPDSLLAIASNADNSANLWDLATGLPLATLRAHRGLFRQMAFAADGKGFYSVGDDGNLIVWSLTTLKSTSMHQLSASGLLGFAISPSLKQYAVSGGEGTPLELRDASTNNVVQTYKLAPNRGDLFLFLEFSRDGSLLLSGSDGFNGRLFDLKRGVEIPLWADNMTARTILSNDASAVFYGDAIGMVMRRPIPRGKAKGYRAHVGMVTALAESADGSVLATGGQDRTIVLSDPLSMGKLTTFRGFPDSVDNLVVSPDAHYLLAQCGEGLYLINLRIGRQYLGSYEKAAAARDRLDATPNDPQSLLTLGLYYAQCSADAWAAELLTRARTAGADVASLPLARAYWRLHEFAQADREFHRAIERAEAPEYYLRLCINEVENPPATAPSAIEP